MFPGFEPRQSDFWDSELSVVKLYYTTCSLKLSHDRIGLYLEFLKHKRAATAAMLSCLFIWVQWCISSCISITEAISDLEHFPHLFILLGQENNSNFCVRNMLSHCFLKRIGKIIVFHWKKIMIKLLITPGSPFVSEIF